MHHFVKDGTYRWNLRISDQSNVLLGVHVSCDETLISDGTTVFVVLLYRSHHAGVFFLGFEAPPEIPPKTERKLAKRQTAISCNPILHGFRLEATAIHFASFSFQWANSYTGE